MSIVFDCSFCLHECFFVINIFLHQICLQFWKHIYDECIEKLSIFVLCRLIKAPDGKPMCTLHRLSVNSTNRIICMLKKKQMKAYFSFYQGYFFLNHVAHQLFVNRQILENSLAWINKNCGASSANINI